MSGTETLEMQERIALDRVGAAARDLNRSLIVAGGRLVQDEAWVLPALGFVTGLLASFVLVPIVPRRHGGE